MIISMLTFGQVAMWAILAVGLFNSIMFPTIFTLAIDGLGSIPDKLRILVRQLSVVQSFRLFKVSLLTI